MKRISASIGAAVALAFALPVRAGTPRAYVGSDKCRPCHQAQYRSWAATSMSKTFELLKPGVAVNAKLKSKLDPNRDYTRDAACLPCHTTGYGKPGGFVDPVKTPDRLGVGCEDCHGAGGAYAHLMASRGERKAAWVAAGLVAEVTKEQCTDCHNPTSPIGTVVGSRHFVKQFVFTKTKGIHESRARLKP